MRNAISIIALIVVAPIALVCGALVWADKKHQERQYWRQK
jgi:hypothetical protein